MNTGGFTPTNGQYAFDYCTNDFSRSLPSIFREMGYSAQSFHYNSPLFYNRGLMEPPWAMKPITASSISD